MRAWRAGALSFVCLLGEGGCGPITEAAPEEGCKEGRAVDPWKELLVVDEAVVTSEDAANATGGALGFRHVAESLAQGDAATAVLSWLEGWAPPTFTCAWLRDRVANACDATCASCAARHVDLARAPFRLIALANRVDLAEREGAGEARLVFAATDGPGDDPASPALPLTVIAEFRLTDPRAWATAFRALGERVMGPSYVRALAELARRFVQADGLAQVRVDDAARGPPAVMLEFHLDDARRLVPAGLRRTPRQDGDPAVLGRFVADHADEILEDRHELPADMLAARVLQGRRWALAGVDEPVRRAFASSTCDGCHGTEHPAIDGFHVAPHLRGIAKVSRFLFDPERRDDELARRADVLRRLACRP